MKGALGRFLTFLLGLVVGVLLVGGTIAGVVYYAVAGVTINDVENYTKQEFTFIDKNAEIRGKSLLDIYDMMKGGNIRETTVADAKRVFGIDIITILENTLEIKVDDKNRDKLSALKVTEIFKGDNLKTVLNCVTLGDILQKTGVDTTTGLASKPILQEHINEPVIDGLNAMLKSFEINNMTIAEMQYLLGVSFGAGGVLDTIANVKIGELNSAINNVKFEDILPDFDRDHYTMWDSANKKAVRFSRKSAQFTVNSLFKTDGTSDFFEYVPTDKKVGGETYYALDAEKGIIKVSDNGNWKLKEGKELPDFRNRYDKEGNQNRFGIAYVVPKDSHGMTVTERYKDDACTISDESGLFYYEYTENASGDYYRVGAAIRTKIQDATATEPAKYSEIIEWRGYVEKTKADYFEAEPWKTYGYSRSGEVTDEKLMEHDSDDALAIYALMHVGKSEPVLKALADETLNTLDGAIGDMKLGQIVTINDDSPAILKELKNSSISSIGEDIKKIKIGTIMKVNADNVAEKATDGEYIALPAGKEYKGTFITAKDGDKTVYLVKYKDGLTGFGDRYNITEKASNGVVVALADKTIGELQTAGIDDLINTALLSSVMDIDGDVFVEDTSGKFVFDTDTAGKNGFFRLAQTGESATHKRVYEGASNAVVKKLSTVGVQNIANRMDDVVDSTLLKEVVDVQERYELRKATTDEIANNAVKKYFDLTAIYGDKDTVFEGTFNVGYDQDDEDKKDIRFVSVGDTSLPAGTTQYVIVKKASSGVLVGLQDKTIGNLSSGVDVVVGGTKLHDVLEIDGRVYVKANNYEEAVANSVTGTAYYKDGNLFLEADYIRNKNGKYVKIDGKYYEFGNLYKETAGGYVVDNANGTHFLYEGNYYKIADYKRYNFDGETVTEFYACVYEGKTEKILAKMATMTVQDLAKDGTMEKVMNDMRLNEVMKIKDSTSILYGLDNSKLSSVEAEVTDKIKDATLRELNNWGNLGLKETDDELKKKVYYNGATIEVGDMKAVEFLILAIKALPTLP